MDESNTKHLENLSDEERANMGSKEDSFWKENLTTLQYQVCRKKKTERAFTGKYHDCKENGVYHCSCYR